MAKYARAKVYTKAEALEVVESMARFLGETYGFVKLTGTVKEAAVTECVAHMLLPASGHKRKAGRTLRFDRFCYGGDEAGMKIMTSTPSEKNLTDQAPYIVTSAVQSLSTGTDKHFRFVLAPYIENAGDFGTFSPDLEPYPTLAAESAMTHVLGEGQYLGELCDLPEGAYGYLFFTGSRAASVLWAGESTSYTFAAEQAVIVTDLMGNQTLIKPENGQITLEIGVDPVFVTLRWGA